MNMDNTESFDLRLRKWIRYELAARKIQRLYRQWRMHCTLSRRIKLNGLKRLNRSYDISDRKGKIEQSKSTTDDFQSVLKQTAGFDDKCAMWMRVVDLKRMFPDKSTDMMLRALIESQGDIGRAQILLGTSDFIFQNYQALPSSVRSIFTPHVGPFEQQASRYDVKFTKLLLVSTSRFARTLPSEDFTNPEINDDIAISRHGRSMDLIRSLRGKYVQTRKQELMDTFLKVVEKGYFGQAGQKGKLNTQARPKSATFRR